MEWNIEITELRKLQKIIKGNAEKSIIVLDSLNKIVFVNDTFTDLTGYHIDEVRGRSPLSLGIGDNSPEQFLELLEVVGKGETFVGEFENQKKNGETYYTQTSIIPIYKDPRNVTYYIAISKIIKKDIKISDVVS